MASKKGLHASLRMSAAMVVFALIVSSCSSSPDASEAKSLETVTSVVEVGAGGFSVEETVKETSVAISGSAGVAPAGTHLNLEVFANSSSALMNETLDEYLSWSPGGIKLTFDAGLQPAQPVTITFTLPRTATPESVDRNTLVGLRQSADGSIAVLPVQHTSLDDNHYQFTVVTDHFSGIVVAGLDPGKWFDAAFTGVQQWLNVGDKPDCFGDEVTIAGVRYRAEGALVVQGRTITDRSSEQIYACVVDRNGSPGVRLTSADNVSWAVRSDPEPTKSEIGELNIESNIADDVSRFASGEDFLIPGGSLELTYPTMPDLIQAKVDPGPMLVLSTIFGVTQLLSVLGMNDWATTSAMIATAASCVSGEANAFKDNEPVQYVSSHLGCITGAVSEVLEKKVGAILAAPVIVVLNALNGGVQLVVGQTTGAARSIASGLFGSEIFGAESIAILVSAEESQSEVRPLDDPVKVPTDEPMDATNIAKAWTSKGARLTLIPNYTGTLNFNSGCCNEREWSIAWDQSGADVTLRVGELKRSQGTVSPQLVPGDTVMAKVDNGVMSIYVPDEYGQTYEVRVCTAETVTLCPF
ncbi:hypothetical protein [Rhodococcus sp. NBC_00297]|uniref:hypothetical protein n=1 Tax=Rhodococcus sp. NBC_00297 TaxID=2976005 RepID=UPI002E2E1098|nr:hypothetical protein [Rhodococcus sp. NBC_00297]